MCLRHSPSYGSVLPIIWVLSTLKTLHILHFISPLIVPDADFQAPLYKRSGVVESLIFSSQPHPWLFTSFLLMKQANFLCRCNVTLSLKFWIQAGEGKQETLTDPYFLHWCPYSLIREAVIFDVEAARAHESTLENRIQIKPVCVIWNHRHTGP